MSQPIAVLGPSHPPASVSPAEGKLVNVSCNTFLAMSMMVEYLKSTYDLQAQDTKMEAAITNAEAEEVTQFQNALNDGFNKNPFAKNGMPGYGNFIYLLEHFEELMKKWGYKPGDAEYSAQQTVLTNLLSAAQSKNQAEVKVMDGNNSTAQNVLSQNAQNQPGILQAMSSISGIEGNLARILQG